MRRVWRVALAAVLASAGADACRARGSEDVASVAVASEASSFNEAAERVRQSTVAIQTTWTRFDETGLPMFGRVEGSGFVVGDGLVVTNAHVVEEAGRVHVRHSDGEGCDAEVLGVDAARDLAVIAMEIAAVPVVLGRSGSLRVGDPVAVVGDALGHEFVLSMRVGVVAGVDRSIATDAGRHHDGLLELDLDLAEGQSGGPVIDRSGSVVGVATVAMAGAGGGAFAIAIDEAVPVIDRLRRGR